MAQSGLDNLLKAIHNAVIHAQEVTEEQHVRQLKKYFGPDNKPYVKHIKVPNLDPNSKPGDMIDIAVPLISMIPPTAIKIKEMKVKFQVGLNSNELMGTGDKESSRVNIDLGGSGGNFGSKQALADIEITFQGTDPSESFLRINDHLVKSII